MSSAQKGSKKLNNQTIRHLNKAAETVVQHLFINGAGKYTEEGLSDAKLMLIGIGSYLNYLGCKEGVAFCSVNIQNIDHLLKTDTARAQVWQNIKDHLAEAEKNENEMEGQDDGTSSKTDHD